MTNFIKLPSGTWLNLEHVTHIDSLIWVDASDPHIAYGGDVVGVEQTSVGTCEDAKALSRFLGSQEKPELKYAPPSRRPAPTWRRLIP